MAGNSSQRPDDYPVLSRPLDSLRPEYDVVVVGSGYGAAVAASRMARAGKSVAVLELGWERRPGSFPQSFTQCVQQMQIFDSLSENSWLPRLFPQQPTRLFQLILGEGQHLFVAHGLGGGSLINCGVFLKADEQTLQMSPWPPEIRNDTSALQPYYARAAAMLQPTVYPETLGPVKKMEHLQELSRQSKQPQNFYKVPLTTFFEDRRNDVGVMMRENNGSGQECTGLNDGSKNSVATTYLADAWNWGAEIFCGCEVRFVEQAKDGKGYIVYFARHGNGREAFKEEFKHQLCWVKAKEFCFLGAGTLGTTEILLRSKMYSMQMSPLVGRNMSCNGDMLLFGYDGRKDVNGIGGGKALTQPHPGPTITSVIDNRLGELENSLAGFVIEDGCIPAACGSIVQTMLILHSLLTHTPFSLSTLRLRFHKLLKMLWSLIAGPYVRGGPIQRTSTYLIMCHDSNEATLSLKGDMPKFRAPAESQLDYYTGLISNFNKLLGQVGQSMGRVDRFGGFSTHPLGGANMSHDGTGRGGVTNQHGEVFSGHGSDVYQGLVCCDASVIPTALGVNPIATITALAERSVDLLAEKYSFSINFKTSNGKLGFDNRPRVASTEHFRANIPSAVTKQAQTIGWQFTELLEGYINVTSKHQDFSIHEKRGKSSSCAMRAYLTIEIFRHLKDRAHFEGKCIGTVSCFALSNAPLQVTQGRVGFFTQEETNGESRVISYFLELLSIEGKRFCLNGRKVVDSNISFSISAAWKATTRVNVSITAENGSPIAGGVLRISLPHFSRQMTTFRSTLDFRMALIWPLFVFFAYFLYNICLSLLGPFEPSQLTPKNSEEPVIIKVQPSRVLKLRTKDNIQVLLEAFEPTSTPNQSLRSDGSKPAPILCLPGVTGVGAKHHLFALPYSKCNAVEYFTSRGHICYLLTPRWGGDWPVAENSTVYDCRLDIAAAIEYINSTELQKPYVFAHCQGSVALAMGLLDGTISGKRILGITANSVFMTEVFGFWNAFKGRTTAIIRLYELIAGNFFPTLSSSKDSAFQRVLDFLIRFYPVSRRDICSSSVCHRTSFAFGLLWNHENLDRNLHDNIHQFLAGAHTKMMTHVVRMGTYGMCLNNQLQPLMTPGNLERLRGIPILFMSGTANEVFKPESTLRDYELLRRRFGEENYSRFLPECYGHLDPIMGKDAARDVFWRVSAHVQSCMAGASSRGKGEARKKEQTT